MKPKRGRWLAAGAATVVGIAVATVLPASAQASEPEEVPGNPTCEEGLTSFKVDSPTDGEHSDGTLTVQLTLNDTEEGQTIGWTSNISVQVVIVKGGPNANVYDYGSGGSTEDTGLHAPAVESDDWADVSHIEFCYVVGNGTTTTSTTSTTVPGETTTTVPGETTTTVPGATPTTMAPSPAPAVPPAPTAQPVTAVPTFTG